MECLDSLNVEWVAVGDLFENPANPRRNEDAVPHVAASLRRFGWQQPLVVKASGEVSAGIQWLFGVYLLHTIGELCLSPVGLSAMTKLAPARLVGQMMGVWFLAASIGNYLGGSVAGYYEKLDLPNLLMTVAVSAFVMAAVMFALVKPIERMLAVSKDETARDPAISADD